MRLFSFVLALYFLDLSVMTCNDSVGHRDDSQTAAYSQIVPTDGCQHDDGTDVCSPLCMCQCCGGITLVEQANYSFTAFAVTNQIPDHISSKVSGISPSIWQPPKV